VGRGVGAGGGGGRRTEGDRIRESTEEALLATPQAAKTPQIGLPMNKTEQQAAEQ
jgi:hypothetical protein